MFNSPTDLSAGELRAAPLASLLIEALRRKVSGELEICSSGGTSRLYLRGGHPCGVQVFFGFKSLGQFLLELGWIDLDGLERSLMAVADGRKQGEALVSLGLLTPAQLERGLSLLHRGHISTLAALEEGTYTFEPRTSLPSWTETIHLRAHRGIVDAMLLPPGRPIAQRIFAEGLPDGEKLRLRQGWERFAPHFELSPDELEFVSQLVEPQTIHGVARGELEESHAAALMAAFLLMGLAIPERDGERSPGPAAERSQPSFEHTGGPNAWRLNRDILQAAPRAPEARAPAAGASPEPEGGGIRNPDVRQLVAKGESLLLQRRFSQALAFFMQALQFEEHPEIRAHAIWAANADPGRPAHDRARLELERLAGRHPTCGQISHYLNALDLLDADGVS